MSLADPGWSPVSCSRAEGVPNIAEAGMARRGPRRRAGTRIAYPAFVMRVSVLAAAALVFAAETPAQEPPRVLEVTLADLDEDSLDFLIGWDRGKSDILDLAAEGHARFTFAPLIAIAPGLAPDGRLAGWSFASAATRASRRSARLRSPRPVRVARSPRGRTSDRRTPRRPRGLAPFARNPRLDPDRPPGRRPTGQAPGRGPRGFAAGAPRGGSRTGAGGGTGPSGKAHPRGFGARPRDARGTRNGTYNGRDGNPRPRR